MNIILIITTLLVAYLLLRKPIRRAPLWRATVTPLASIIGSGFLVIAPLLAFTVGNYAVLAITGFVILAYFIGNAVRYNIRYLEPILQTIHPTTTWIKNTEEISRLVLGIAYIISIVFYLKLLAAFILEAIHYKDALIINIIASVLLIGIGAIGFYRGLSKLEIVEEYAVSIKLAIIIAFLLALAWVNFSLLENEQWSLAIQQPTYSFDTLKILLGMLIIIQGFETSRFIGHKYSPETRIKTMRYAQIISGVIYILFIALMTVLFSSMENISETEIINVSRKLSYLLPFLLIIAAVTSQLSAAIADTIGSGGLLSEASRYKFSHRQSYLLITFCAIVLVWSVDIFGIISLASRGFALYYALQCLIAMMLAMKYQDYKRALFYSLLSIFLLMAAVIGTPIT